MADCISNLVEQCRENNRIHKYDIIYNGDARELPGVYRILEHGGEYARFEIDEVEWEYKILNKGDLFFSNIHHELRSVFLISKVFNIEHWYNFARERRLIPLRLALSYRDGKFKLIVLNEKNWMFLNYFTEIQEGEFFTSGRLTKGVR